MQLAYLHGEGILFSFLIHCFFVLLTAAVLLYGVVKYKSSLGTLIAAGYVVVTLIFILLAQTYGNLLLESVVWTLTLPWNRVVPCYNLDSTCQLTVSVSLICAGLNATVLYFLVARVSRRK